MTDIDVLFQPVEPDPIYGVDLPGRKKGRYCYPAPPGEVGSDWMRMTNLVSAFSDQKALQNWLAHKQMMGLRADDGLLFDEWMAEHLDGLSAAEERAVANRYAERAQERAGSKDAARRGTARHNMMEAYFATGAKIGTRAMQVQRDDMLELLDELDYDFVPDSEERKVWHPIAGGTMGKTDGRVMCRRTGQQGIIDWKTQAKFWTFQEICGQLYGYDSAKWAWVGPDNDGGRWERLPERWAYPLGLDSARERGVGQADEVLTGRPGTKLAGRRVALVAHMPLAGPVEVYQVSMLYGKAVLETAARNVELRSIGRSESEKRMPVERLTP